jgi:hypothetical protein
MKEQTLPTACPVKKRWPMQTSALAQARRETQKDGKARVVYQCADCHLWHIRIPRGGTHAG